MENQNQNQSLIDNFFRDVNDITNAYAVKMCIVPPDAYKPIDKVLPSEKLTMEQIKEKHGIVAAEVDKAKATIKGMLNALLKTMGCGTINDWFYTYNKTIDVCALSNGLYQLDIKDITILETSNPEVIYQNIMKIVSLNKDEFEDEN